MPCAAGYADQFGPGQPLRGRTWLDVTADAWLACRPGVSGAAHGPSARHPAAAVWEVGQSPATVLARMAHQPEKWSAARCWPGGSSWSTLAGDHHEPHPPHLPIAGQLTRRPVSRSLATRPCPPWPPPPGPEPARWTTHPPVLALALHHRYIRAARRRCDGSRGKAAHESACPAATTHHLAAVSTAGRTRPVLGSRTAARRCTGPGARPAARDRPGPRHDPVRELAPCHGGHEAQVPALGHADLGIPCRKDPALARVLLLTLVPTGIDDAAPGPRQATP